MKLIIRYLFLFICAATIYSPDLSAALSECDDELSREINELTKLLIDSHARETSRACLVGLRRPDEYYSEARVAILTLEGFGGSNARKQYVLFFSKLNHEKSSEKKEYSKSYLLKDIFSFPLTKDGIFFIDNAKLERNTLRLEGKVMSDCCSGKKEIRRLLVDDSGLIAVPNGN